MEIFDSLNPKKVLTFYIRNEPSIELVVLKALHAILKFEYEKRCFDVNDPAGNLIFRYDGNKRTVCSNELAEYLAQMEHIVLTVTNVTAKNLIEKLKKNEEVSEFKSF